jgi:hypothetical protein
LTETEEAMAVLQALGRGALLFEDSGGGARMGCYLSEGEKRLPVRSSLFRTLEEQGCIVPVGSQRIPQRWRATERGQALVAGA